MSTLDDTATAPTVTMQALSNLTSRSWTGWQLRWIGFQLGMLGALVIALLVWRYDFTKGLWRHAVGLKMLTQISLLLLVGFSVSYLVCRLIDRRVPHWHERHPYWGTFTAAVLVSVQFLGLIMPAVFVVMLGPTAVEIVVAGKMGHL